MVKTMILWKNLYRKLLNFDLLWKKNDGTMEKIMVL